VALSALFSAGSPPVTAVKGTTGHTIGGSGAIEAIMTMHALRSRVVPPVAGTQRLDPDLDLDVVVGNPRPVDGGYGLSNSFGFGGVNACLVLGPPP
jgi:3-oxoacyl-[acyl-carrier-protein] synthase II